MKIYDKKILLFYSIFFLIVLSFTDSCALLRFDSGRPRVPYNKSDVRLVKLFEVFNAIEDVDTREIMRLIKQYPYLIVMQDSRGYTPLHHAVAAGDIRSLRTLLICDGIERSFVIQDKFNGHTPLHSAVLHGGDQFVMAFIINDNIHGAFVIKERYHGDTPLHLSVRMRNMDAMRSLLIHKLIKLSFGKRNINGFTPLALFYYVQKISAERLTVMDLDLLESEYKKSSLLQAFHELRIVGSKVLKSGGAAYALKHSIF